MGAFNYLLVSILILLAACGQELRTVPTAERVLPVNFVENMENATVDLCASVSCPSGQKCDNGNCTCITGKICDGECISSSACCTDKDCASGPCEDNKCTTAQCKLGEEFYKGKCECGPNKIYCSEQGKCIEHGKCCVHSECKSGERCVPVQYRVSVCMKTAEKKFCRLVSDTGRGESFITANQSFEVKPIDWFADHSIELNVSNTNVTMPENVTVTLNGAQFYQEGVQIIGGYCKEDEED